MKDRRMKKDAGTIFNPVMFLMILILTVQLLMLFVEYKRVAWVSGAVTNAMTDALLGACTLNEEELYRYGSSDELEILYPREKYEIFQDILCQELGLKSDLHTGGSSVPLLLGEMDIKDFQVYSVCKDDITVYDFAEDGSYSISRYEDMAGVYTAGNGVVIDRTTLVAEVGFAVDFFGVPVEVSKYHMVDVTN